jgi:protein-disulfide isomerase
MTRASTRGSDGGGTNSLILWSVVAVVVAVVVVVGLVLTSQSKSNTSGAPNSPGVLTPTTITWNGQTLGNANAPVTIDLYGDFRCSACLVFTIEGDEGSLVKDYVATGQAKLVWHDFITIDKTGETASRDAANAAWCAADQGKFWLMHDWLYANQGPSEDASYATPDRLIAIAKAAGLDMSKWQSCFDGGTHNDAIAQEQTSLPSDAGGTPALYVKGKLVAFTSYADIQAAMNTALGLPGPCASTSPTATVSPTPSGSQASASPSPSPSGSPTPSPTACISPSPVPTTSASPTGSPAPGGTPGPTPSSTPSIKP